MKRCVYCNSDLHEECVVDVCEKCGYGVWGEKMFRAIQENMMKAKIKGNID